jgi:hypothetical protein
MQSFSYPSTVRSNTFCRSLSEVPVAIPITPGEINPACQSGMETGSAKGSALCRLRGLIAGALTHARELRT